MTLFLATLLSAACGDSGNDTTDQDAGAGRGAGGREGGSGAAGGATAQRGGGPALGGGAGAHAQSGGSAGTTQSAVGGSDGGRDAASGTDGSAPGADASPGAGGAAGQPVDGGAYSDGAAGAVVDAGSSVDAGDAGGPCAAVSVGPAGPRSGRSGGYSGTLDDYSNLYKVACTGMSECIASCEQAGGTTSSCTEGSECTTGTDRHCLPPTYWRYEDEALVENDTSNGAGVAEQTLVKIHYQDPLVLSDFGLQIPPNAKIRGIQFDVRKGALTADMAVDDSVRALRGGQPVGTDHKQAGKNWPATLTYVSYGGPNDTWGESWTPADLTASGFGISIAARYLDTAGNDRAYVDYARVTVFYAPGNCP